MENTENNLNEISKLKTNRNSTRGRRIYFQHINNKDGKLIRTIKHIQESNQRLAIAFKMVQIYDAKLRFVESRNENTITKKQSKYYGYYVAVRTEPKIGRNEPCPCGSGKKYKKCCLN